MSGVAIITGGSRGIGAEVARRAAAGGWDVCLSYRAEADAAQAVVADCIAAGAKAVAVPADVAAEADVLRLFAAAAELGQVTALVNNAGIVGTKSTLVDMDTARIERMLAVNVLGAILCAREAARVMSVAAGGPGGVIVNVSSRAAQLGSAGEYVDYAASKAAVDTLTLGLAREMATDGVRVVGVRPGLIDTDIHASGGQPDRLERLAPTIPMGRGGRVEEVAAAILWLMSPEASYVTASILDVSGGR